ncbi:MAG: hypothetical protein IPL97_03330 [Niastella sp.]|nr:hypothetical protein [Niastella sp.]
MLKYRWPCLLTVLFLISCRDTQKPTAGKQISEINADTTSTNFFPVTPYLKGQLHELKSLSLSPIRIITHDKKEDSTWLKLDVLENELSPFFSFNIDSANLKPWFEQKSFLDQTLNAFTFTYDPVKPLPDSISVRHYDVYVNPENNRVTRIYIVLKTPGNKEQQLTWQTGKWAKIITLHTAQDGNTTIESDKKIIWDY